jgi:hypothetical protein
MLFTMPTEWIDDLPREEALKMAIELGVPAKGAVQEIRQRLKEKWTNLEQYVPPPSTDESKRGLDVEGSGNVYDVGSDIQGPSKYLQAKLRGKVITDLLGGIPVLRNTEPESVFEFLVRVRQVYDLGLVTDKEFLTHIITRTTGRLTQIDGAHFCPESSWEVVS